MPSEDALASVKNAAIAVRECGSLEEAGALAVARVKVTVHACSHNRMVEFLNA